MTCLSFHSTQISIVISSTGFQLRSAVLKDKSSLSVLFKFAAVTNDQTKLLTVSCSLVAEKQPPQSVLEHPASLLKDSTNQPEKTEHFAEAVSYPDREKTRVLSAAKRGVWPFKLAFLVLLGSESLVCPPKSGFTKLLRTDHPSSSSVKQLATTNHEPMCKHYMLMQNNA